MALINMLSRPRTREFIGVDWCHHEVSTDVHLHLLITTRKKKKTKKKKHLAICGDLIEEEHVHVKRE
jgi:hypothetical protein